MFQISLQNALTMVKSYCVFAFLKTYIRITYMFIGGGPKLLRCKKENEMKWKIVRADKIWFSVSLTSLWCVPNSIAGMHMWSVYRWGYSIRSRIHESNPVCAHQNFRWPFDRETEPISMVHGCMPTNPTAIPFHSTHWRSYIASTQNPTHHLCHIWWLCNKQRPVHLVRY